MNLEMAIVNWRNFFRQAVGKSKIYPVKVKRTEGAKRYPLIHASKKGDVGYNLAATKGMTIPAATEEQIRNYRTLMTHAKLCRTLGDMAQHEEMKTKALNLLPKAIVPTGIHLQMPESIWCSIEARSSSSSKMLITPDAIIDTGYTGELFVVIYNFGMEDYWVSQGEMLAQLIFHERIDIKPMEVDKLKATDRGTSGFGSTGANAREVKRGANT